MSIRHILFVAICTFLMCTVLQNIISSIPIMSMTKVYNSDTEITHSAVDVDITDRNPNPKPNPLHTATVTPKSTIISPKNMDIPTGIMDTQTTPIHDPDPDPNPNPEPEPEPELEPNPISKLYTPSGVVDTKSENINNNNNNVDIGDIGELVQHSYPSLDEFDAN